MELPSLGVPVGDNGPAVTGDDVQLVRELLERRKQGDYAVELLDPEIVYTQNGSDVPDLAGHWVGVKGIRDAARGWLSVAEDARYTLEDVAPADDPVVVRERLAARGKQSQVDIAHVIVQLLQFVAAS